MAGNRPGESVRVLGRGPNLTAAVRLLAPRAGVGAYPRRQQQETGQQAAPAHDLRLALPAGQKLRGSCHEVRRQLGLVVYQGVCLYHR